MIPIYSTTVLYDNMLAITLFQILFTAKFLWSAHEESDLHSTNNVDCASFGANDFIQFLQLYSV